MHVRNGGVSQSGGKREKTRGEESVTFMAVVDSYRPWESGIVFEVDTLVLSSV